MNTATTAVAWPKAPYKGLAYYTPEDVALFGGRQNDVRECARVLVREETKVLFLHGRSACGKSSFLRAGLIPYLESRVPVFKFLPDFDITKTRALFIRCTDQPLVRLAETIYDWGEKPFLIDVGEDEPLAIDTARLRGGAQDRARFAAEVGNSVPRMMSLLREIHDLFPKWLILVIDQGEEILSLTRGEKGQESRELFFQFITAFNKSSLNLKLVTALRSEYWGDFLATMRQHGYEESQIHWYSLKELSYDELVEAVRIPTSRSIPERYLQGRCQPADEYNFVFEGGLPERIVQDLLHIRNKQGGILSVLQIACGRLYRQVKQRNPNTERWVITARDYAGIGDLEQQIDIYLDETIGARVKQQLPRLSEKRCEEELALWKDLLWELVVVEEDGRALTTIFSEDELRDATLRLGCRVNFDAMMQYLALEDQRVLREDRRSTPGNPARGPGTSYYSLGHDTIAVALRRWRDRRGLVLDRRGFVRNILLWIALAIAGGCVLASAALAAVMSADTYLRELAVIGVLLIVAGGLFLGRAQIADLLSKSLVSATAFRGLFAETSQTQHLIRQMQASFDAGLPQTPSEQERQLLRGAAEVLRAKPEKDYKADDWVERAFAAYAEGKLDLSAEYFGQAATAHDASPPQRAEYIFNRGVLFGELQRGPEALAAYDEVLTRFSHATGPTLAVTTAKALLNKGVTLGTLGRGAEEIATYEDVLSRFGTASELPLREQVARALVNKGIALGALGRSAEAIAASDDVLARFGTATELTLREQVAKAFVNKGFTLGALGRSTEAIAAYDDLLARFDTASELPLREQVAKALVNKGITLAALDRTTEEIAIYDVVVARFGTARELPLCEQVAKALVNKGVRLGARGGSAEEIAAYDAVLARFGTAPEPTLREQVAKALVNKGIALAALGRSAEEIAVYDDVLARFGTASELALREQVARALVNKGGTLGALDRSTEAIAALDDVVARFGAASELPLRERVARALVNKGFRLGALGRSAEAIVAYDDVLARFGSASELPLRELVARGLVNKGVRLGTLNRSTEEIAAYDDVLARFSTASELALRDQVARALVNKGITLGTLDRSAEAIATYDDLLARFGTASELPLCEQVARTLINKGVRLGTLGRSEEEIAAYDDVLARFGTASELELCEQVARALVYKGVTLGALDRSTEAIAAYDDVLARFGTASELALREQVATALVNKGVRLGALGRSAEEIAAYDDVLARFGTATELPLRELIGNALFNKGITLGTLGRTAEANATYDDLLARFGTATEPTLRGLVAEVKSTRAAAQES